MAEINVYKISGIFETAGVSKGVEKYGSEMQRIKRYTADTKKEMAGLYDLKPLREGSSPVFREIRNQRAEMLRSLRSAASSQSTSGLGSLFGGDLLQQDRARFVATGFGRESAAAAKASEGWLDKAVKIGAVIAVIKGTIAAVKGGIEGVKAVSADIAGDFENASKGYLGFAENLKKIPVVGGIAYDIADVISGGAAGQARQALDDAKRIEAEAAERTRKHKEQRAQGEAEIAKLRRDAELATLEGLDREKRQAELNHSDELKRIEQLKEQGILTEEQLAEARQRIATITNAELSRIENERYQQGLEDFKRAEAEKVKTAEAAADEIKRIDESVGDFFDNIQRNYEDRVKQIIESTKTNAEQAQERLAEIQAMYAAGSLTDEQARRAISSVGKDLGATRPRFDVPQGDRVHGYGVSIDYFKSGSKNEVATLVETAQKQLVETKRQTAALSKAQSAVLVTLN